MGNCELSDCNPRRPLPGETNRFNAWVSGISITFKHRLAMWGKLGENSEDGKKALAMFREDLRRIGPVNMDTCAQSAGFEGVAAAIQYANEKAGSPILDTNDLKLLEIKDPRITISSLSPENLASLVRNDFGNELAVATKQEIQGS